jgi:hypothetical protein
VCTCSWVLWQQLRPLQVIHILIHHQRLIQAAGAHTHRAEVTYTQPQVQVQGRATNSSNSSNRSDSSSSSSSDKLQSTRVKSPQGGHTGQGHLEEGGGVGSHSWVHSWPCSCPPPARLARTSQCCCRLPCSPDAGPWKLSEGHVTVNGKKGERDCWPCTAVVDSLDAAAGPGALCVAAACPPPSPPANLPVSLLPHQCGHTTIPAAACTTHNMTVVYWNKVCRQACTRSFMPPEYPARGPTQPHCDVDSSPLYGWLGGALCTGQLWAAGSQTAHLINCTA